MKEQQRILKMSLHNAGSSIFMKEIVVFTLVVVQYQGEIGGF